MPEKPKRLKPLPNTLRDLYLRSGNLCAFPNCKAVMISETGKFVGQVCHIEAAEPKGARFNPKMTNEQRRAGANLLLMCYKHHVETDDVKTFTVARMRQIKAAHEKRFSDVERIMLAKLKDWTEDVSPKAAKNLRRMRQVLGYPEEDMTHEVCVLEEHIEVLRTVPVELRQFLGAVAMRIVRVEGQRVVELHPLTPAAIMLSDLSLAFSQSKTAIARLANELDGYGLGELGVIYTDAAGDLPAVRIANLDGMWPFWVDLAKFCVNEAISMEQFTDDLDFTALDAPVKKKKRKNA